MYEFEKEITNNFTTLFTSSKVAFYKKLKKKNSKLIKEVKILQE